jgi:hypothetical protein
MISARLFIVFLAIFSGSHLVGDGLPATRAENLNGQQIDFPAALQGKVSVCVFGFSKTAGDRAKAWMTRLEKEGLGAWSVADLEGAPLLVRGMIKGSMRKGTSESLRARSLVLTKDEKAWRQALDLKQADLPVVAVFDASGQMAWTYEGIVSDDAFARLKTKFEALQVH